ncbi:CMP-N-acetylneuraminate-poly-alpha-2,8-sialyltransferase-like isoform X2 [Anneissia japonica]|uniref:CMP-N-acetylneuraminate-poly-alpha-2, 8-sialyltransferase-like isoform X2 n=1 Tax=Anneissia japonica TaxID=1529436 RepID=UPI001425B000|nr:CMP-N-acetylneuraminate-poly-alpha-2,8-sialyltransferase-like isoform X2 [Anneissia japonica]
MERRSIILRLLSSAILFTGIITIMLVYITSSNLKLAAHFTSKSYHVNYWTSKQFNESDNYDFNTSYSAIKKALYSLRRLLPHKLVILIENQTMKKKKLITKQRRQRIKWRKKQEQSRDDFKALSITLIQNAKWKEVPKIYSTVPKKRSCAVIGNSGILLNSSCGCEIDSHEFVLRSNIAPILGFEKDVGYTHGFVSLNLELSQIATSCLKNSSNPCFEEMVNRFKVYDQSIIWLSKLSGKPSKKTYLGVLSQLQKHNINPKIAYPFTSIGTRIISLWNITNPSSGLYLYTVAASLCDDISLYGFYPFYTSSDGTQLKHHYYENRSMDYAKSHRMPEEFKLFTVLHKFGFIRLVLDRCSQDSRRL